MCLKKSNDKKSGLFAVQDDKGILQLVKVKDRNNHIYKDGITHNNRGMYG